MNLTPGEQLLSYWLKQKLSPPPGVTEADLLATEVRLGVRLPEDVCGFFLTADGSGNWDSDTFEFWPLEKLELIDGPNPSAFAYVEFADYCINAHHYGLKIPRSNPNAASVFLNYWELTGVRELRMSFAEFVARYVAGDHEGFF